MSDNVNGKSISKTILKYSPKQKTHLVDTEIVMIPLETIDFDNTEYCFRVDYKLNDLIEDIAHNGQQFPVLLRRSERSALYQIISGFRRCSTLRELGEPYVKAIIRDDMEDDQAYTVSFLENEKRKNLNGIDKAYAITKLLLKGKSPQEIQNLFGIGERQYYRYKKAVDFPPSVKDAISDGFIKVTHGLILVDAYIRQESDIDLDFWIDWTIENDASVRYLKDAIQKEYSKTKKDVKNYIKATSSGGFRFSTITFDPGKTDRESVDNMILALESALHSLKQWTVNDK